MFCPNCGTKLPDGAKFCTNCGKAAPAPVAPVEPIAEATPVEPIAEATPVEPIAEATPAEPIVETIPIESIIETIPTESVVPAPIAPAPKKKKVAIIITLIVASLLILFAAFFVMDTFVFDGAVFDDPFNWNTSVSSSRDDDDNDDDNDSSGKNSSKNDSSENNSSDNASSDNNSSDNASSDNNSSDNASSGNNSIPVSPNNTVNIAYTNIFTSNGITENRLPAIFYTMENNSYAHQVSDSYTGAVETIHAGYKNNRLVCMTNTVYYTYDCIKALRGTSTLTQNDKNEIFSNWRQTFASIESWSFSDVKYVDTGDTLQIIFTYTDLDDSENLSTLFGSNKDFMTSEEYEDLLVQNNYTKKFN